MSFAPEYGRCIKCHILVYQEPNLIFRHENNNCEHSGKIAFTGTLEFMESENTKKGNEWIEFMP